MEYWSPGDVVVERHLRQGKPWGAVPQIVVRDSPELIALYIPPGTICKRPRQVDGRPLGLMGSDEEWQVADWPWQGEGSLSLVLPGAAHAVYCFWQASEQRSLSCWYINLQKPYRRTAQGFDTLDQTPDVIVSPDRLSWQWKDDDELQELQDRGVVTSEQAAELYREGKRAIALVQQADSPYSRNWAHWSPDPAWPIPTLPADWDWPVE
jgi:hypothetical protein